MISYGKRLTIMKTKFSSPQEVFSLRWARMKIAVRVVSVSATQCDMFLGQKERRWTLFEQVIQDVDAHVVETAGAFAADLEPGR